eukprot:scpid86181/ scgid31828/ 
MFCSKQALRAPLYESLLVLMLTLNPSQKNVLASHSGSTSMAAKETNTSTGRSGTRMLKQVREMWFLSQQGVQIAARRDGSRQISTPTLPNEEQGELGRPRR